MNRHLSSLGGCLSCGVLMAVIHKPTNQKKKKKKKKSKRVANEWSCVARRDRWPVGEPKTPASHPRERGM